MKTKDMTKIALFTAITCILAPNSIPIGAVPISFTNLVLYISVYILGTKKALISYVIYAILGAVGLPVFSGYSGGLAKLVGPTGGYLVGFIFLVIISGIFVEKYKNKFLHILGMILGTAAAYLFGTIWYCVQSHVGFAEASLVCVVPFVVFDLIKIFIAVMLAGTVKNRIAQ